MNVKKVLLGVLACVLVLGMLGCQSVSEKIGEEVGEEIAGGVLGGDVEVDGDSVTVETEDGSVTMSGSEGELPDGFPSDFPIYDGVDIDSVSTIEGDSGTDYYINLYSDDSPKDVYDWYKSELSSAGWNIDSDLYMAESGDDSAIFSVTKGTSQASIAIGVEGDSTSLVLIVMDGK